MIEGSVKLGTLKKKDCFMYNGKPFKILCIYYETDSIIKLKRYECKCKFQDWKTCLTPDAMVYPITNGLYNILELKE